MPDSQNKLSKFWNELKRRKVVRVTIIYASTAFILLQVISMLKDFMTLPPWVGGFFLVLLLVGLPIVVILAWIFDITPEGIEITASTDKKIEQPTTTKSRKKQIILDVIIGILLVIVVILAWPRVFKSGQQKVVNPEIEKSIAVLPFKNESSDQENEYFINGMMESLLDNLCKIEDLRVISRTSIEKYRNDPKPTPLVAEEMNVNYVVEGSGQKLGNRLLLTIQLILGNEDRHLWSTQYDKTIEKVEDLIDIQKEIAQLVAGEIEAVITPEEQKLIEKIPTTNLTAYDLTLQAQKFYYDYVFNQNKGELEKVKKLCYAALELDPGFALAYYWLGNSSLSDKYDSGFPLPFFLDTALYFFNKAIELDSTLSEAYQGRGYYYIHKAETQKAVDDLNKSISLSPNNSMAYFNLAYAYFLSRDYVDALKNFKKSNELTKSAPDQLLIYVMMYLSYMSVGDFQKAELYSQKMEQINHAGALYKYWLPIIYGKYDEALTEVEKYLTLHPEDVTAYDFKARALLGLGRIQEAEDCIRLRLKYAEPNLNEAHRVGIVLWMNGKKDEAMKYFDMQIDNCVESINSKDEYGQMAARYDLAGVYAFLGNKEAAYKWLREFEKPGFIRGLHELIKIDPLFDNLRNDDEFKAIVKKANEKAAENRAKINELEKQGVL